MRSKMDYVYKACGLALIVAGTAIVAHTAPWILGLAAIGLGVLLQFMEVK